MNSQKLTELVQNVRAVHDLAVHRAEGKYLNMVEIYNIILTSAVKKLINLGDSRICQSASWVQEYHFEVLDKIILKGGEFQWRYHQLFEKAMVELERDVKEFIQESKECSCGQPVCPDCSTDIENCSCQDEVAISKDGEVKATNEEPDMRTPTMLWMDIIKAAHKQTVSKDGKMYTGITTDTDVVDNPIHYQLFPGTEAIEVISKSLTTEEFRGYCLGNALKYRLRAGKKDKAEQDLSKADKYIELYNKYKL